MDEHLGKKALDKHDRPTWVNPLAGISDSDRCIHHLSKRSDDCVVDENFDLLEVGVDFTRQPLHTCSITDICSKKFYSTYPKLIRKDLFSEFSRVFIDISENDRSA